MATLSMINNFEGKFKLPFTQSEISQVSVLDIDLVVVLKTGERFVLVGGALDAMSVKTPEGIFSDGSSLLLSKLLGLVSEFGTSATDSPFAAPDADHQGGATSQMTPSDQQVVDEQQQSQAPAAPPAQAVDITQTDNAASDALKVVSGLNYHQEIAQLTPERVVQQITLPTERAGSVPVPFMGSVIHPG